MAMPVKVSEVEASVPLTSDSLAEKMRKTFLVFPIILYRVLNYMFDSTGGFTTDFAADICAIQCPKPTTTTTTT